MEIKAHAVSALEKVYKSKEQLKTLEHISGLKGETVSFQIDYILDYGKLLWGKLTVEGGFKDCVRVRKVENVPVNRPKDSSGDEYYLETEPCCLPDLLRDIEDDTIPLLIDYHRALWVDIEIPEDAVPGKYDISFRFFGEWREDNAETVVTVTVEVIDAVLPKLDICHTEWFYADCIADYYGLEPMSDEFFEACRLFVRTAVKRNINTILTPVFTPALDTEVGLERTTTQLADVYKEGDKYSFSFANLERFIKMCLEEGVEYFEISHLFTQWGCRCAPKIVGYENGVLKKLFGWENRSVSKEYGDFLKQFLPELARKLKNLKVYDRTFWHLSDEPRAAHREDYTAVNRLVRSVLPDVKILDAMSDIEFYKQGLIDVPACGANKITPFLEEKVETLWAYYCCTQTTKSPNRFIAMPSSRNRVLGLQLYKFDVKGFLHWGYNFYNCMYSYHHIDPYLTVDAEGGVPAGDPFLVYPGPGFRPEESIRIMVLSQAFNDYRALKLLESLIGRDECVNMIDHDLTFSDYPMDNDYYTSLRERINARIKDCVASGRS